MGENMGTPLLKHMMPQPRKVGSQLPTIVSPSPGVMHRCPTISWLLLKPKRWLSGGTWAHGTQMRLLPAMEPCADVEDESKGEKADQYSSRVAL